MLPLQGWAQVTLTGTSYSESFDGVGGSLPTGWTVRSGATATALGSTTTLTTAATAWNNTSGAFKNFASADGLTSSASTAAQSGAADRALGVRQTGSFADPGAAFVLQLANTTGFTSFGASFKFQLLDDQPRETTFIVDYGTGSSPSTFTPVGSAILVTAWGSTTVTPSFGTALNNLSGPVWIRIAALAGSANSGNRSSYAIDDFTLSWTAGGPTLATGAVSPASYCIGSAGAGVSVPYTATGFAGGTTFKAQLSNAAGAFTAPTDISALGSANPLAATIPATVTTAGTGYRIRVVSSTGVNAPDNGANLTLVPSATNEVAAFPAPTLTATTAPLSWTNPASCFDDVVIVARQGASTTAGPTGAYSANAAFGTGTDLGGGNYVVYQGTGTSMTVTGLAVATAYTFTIFTRRGTDYSAGVSRTASTTAPTLTTGTVTGSPFCVPVAGGAVSVPYTISGGSFPGGTTFKAQLSSATGSFATPTDISSLGSTSPLSATLPGSVTTGTQYRIRVVASTGTTGTDNGTNLVVWAAATNNVTGLTVTGGANQATVAWTNPASCADDVLIVGIQGSTVAAVPSTATAYVAGSVFGSGTSLGGGQFVVYQGTGTSLTVTGLLTGTTYTFKVFTRRGGDYSDGVAGTATTTAPTITTGTILGSPFCAGATLSVPYTVTGAAFAAGTVFTAQLSSATGSFATPTVVGTATASPISAVIPAGQTSGTQYRIRVVTTTPAVTGSINPTNLTVTALANPTSFAALPGNSKLVLSWVNPTSCFDRVLVVARAASAVTATPTAATYGASAVFGAGDDLGSGAAPNQFVVYRGAGTSVVVTGLTNGTTYHFRIFTQADTAYSTGATTTGVPAVVPELTELLMPQYLLGHKVGASTHTNRVPYAFRVRLSSLQPSKTYRYYNQAVLATDAVTADGAGNPIYANATGNFTTSTSPSLATAGAYGTFTSDAAGEYTGWFVLEPTGAPRFDAGSTVYMQLMLNNGNNGTTVANRVRSVVPVSVRELGLAGNQATGLTGTSLATARNFVVLYDNETGTDRPLAATFVESDGVAQTTAADYAAFYDGDVDGVAGAWGAAIPNDNSLGVRRIEQRKLSDGTLLGCPATDADGLWNSGANTALPNGGASAVAITTLDAPLTCDVVVGFSPAAVTVLERNSGSTVVAVKVTVANAPGAPLTVSVTNTGTGTATLGSDYTFASPQNLSFPVVATYPMTRTVSVTVLGDVLTEPSETIVLALTATGAPTTLYTPTGTLTIADDENIEPGLIVNEFSQGASGTKEFTECLVTGTPGTTIDLRGWVFDDNNGSFSGGASSSTGIATGHIRFSASCTWEKVPVGSIIVFYNQLDPNAKMPADDPTDANLDYVYVVPLTGSTCATANATDYFIGSCTAPSTSNAAYDTPTGAPVWLNVSFANGGDACQLRKPDLSFFHGISFGSGTAGNPLSAANHPDVTLAAADRLYFSASGSGTTYYFDNTTGNEFRKRGNWKTGTASTATETPGAPNSALNRVFIESLRQPYGVSTTTKSYTCEVRANETRTFLDNLGDLIATVRNTSTTNYGNVTAQTVLTAPGTTTSALTGQRVALFQKEWKLTPTTATPAAYEVTFYLTTAEIAAYVSYVNSQLPAGQTRTRERILEFTRLYKISGAAAALPSAATSNAGLEVVTPVIGGYGTDVTSFTASFTSFSSFALGVNIDGVLPVELTRFTAQPTPHGTVAVAWATASEQDAAFFEVQRSATGRPETFLTVGTVRAAGTTLAPQAYAFTDARPLPGPSYYRLRQLDFGGRSHLSPVVAVRLGGPVAATLAAYPMPFGRTLTLQIDAPVAGDAQVQLVDLKGRVVVRQAVAVAAGPTTLVLPTLPLAPGTYFVRVILPDGRTLHARAVKE